MTVLRQLGGNEAFGEANGTTALGLASRFARSFSCSAEVYSLFADSFEETDKMKIQAEPLLDIVSAVFVAAGCSTAEADRIARALVDANLAGHDSHGVVRTQRYINSMQSGAVVANAVLDTVVDGDAFAVVDGNYGFGQTIGPLACELGISKATAHGVAVIGLRRSGHLGRIGQFAEMATAANQISLHFVNVASSTLVAPFGAIDRRMGTNPICIGMPLRGRPALILDFATSVAAEGKALVALHGGKGLPADALISGEGQVTNDPTVLYGSFDDETAPNPRNGPGALRAMGDHKGSGLALMCELIAGAFIGSGTAGPPPQHHGNGMMSIYLAVDKLSTDNGMMTDVLTYIDWFTSARPTSIGDEVLVPGEPERRTRVERESSGIEMTAATWRTIVDAAGSVGVSESEIKALIANHDR